MAQDWLTRNMFLREAEQPTDTKGISSPQFGGSPEQMMSFLQSPQMQQQLAQFGVHFDPSQMRQSPFFSNPFMQSHPQLGGRLTGALSNLASTPNPEMVQGFGAGLNQMAQGLAGGPEMQRQYQMKQLMAPMQAVGMQMPFLDYQRRERLLQMLGEQAQGNQELEQGKLAEKNRSDQAKEQQNIDKINATRPAFNPQTGSTYTYQGAQPAQPSIMGQGIMQEGLPMGLFSPGKAAQQGGWQEKQADLGRIAGVAESKETKATKDQKEGQGAAARTRADNAGSHWQAKYDADKQNRLNQLESDHAKTIEAIQADKNLDDKTKKQMIDSRNQVFEQQKRNLEQGYQSGMASQGKGGQNPLLAPNTQGGVGGQQQSNQPPPGATHQDSVGNYYDAQGNFVAYGPGQGPQGGQAPQQQQPQPGQPR